MSGCMERVGVQVVLGSPFRYPGRKERGQVVSRGAQALDPITGLAFTQLFSCITDAPAFVGPLQCGLCAAHRRIGWVGAFKMLLALCSAPLS